MTKKTGSEIRRERREGDKPEKLDTQGARDELRRAILVAVIVFIGAWLIVLLVASEKGAFTKKEEAPQQKQEQWTIPTTKGGTIEIFTAQAQRMQRKIEMTR